MEDLTSALAVLFAGAIVLTPVMAISLRFTLKPFWDSYLRMRAAQTPELLEKRVALLEAEIQHLDQALSRTLDADDFQRQLMRSNASMARAERSSEPSAGTGGQHPIGEA